MVSNPRQGDAQVAKNRSFFQSLGPEFIKFANALVIQESGGRYNARGVQTKYGRALGRYQILDSNIAAWSKEALGYAITPQQFMANPHLQDQIALFKLGQYYKKYGAKGAAVAWYAGPGAADAWVRNPNAARFNKPQGKFPSINGYANSVVSRSAKMQPTFSGIAWTEANEWMGSNFVGPVAVAPSGPGVGADGKGGAVSPPGTPGAPGMPGMPAGPAQPTVISATPTTTTQMLSGDAGAALPGMGSGPNGEYTLDDYGFARSFFQSDPELKALVDRAVAEQWTPTKFAAALRNTKWYGARTEAEREWIALETGDPTTARRRKHVMVEDVTRQAGKMGVKLSPEQIQQLANEALRFGYSEQEISRALAENVKLLDPKYGSDMVGDAGAILDQYRLKARAYGVAVSDARLTDFVKEVLTGRNTEESFDRWIKEQAKLLYPQLTHQIDKGLTVQDVAGNYITKYAQILEMDPSQIDFMADGMIQQALGWRGEDGKAPPSTMPLWEFERMVKNDPRWLKTNNARSSTMNVAGAILRDFGFKF